MIGDLALAVDALRLAGVEVRPGLTRHEQERIELSLGLTFGPEHAGLLALAVPVGPYWPGWREGAREDLLGRLEWPVEGVVFDVRNCAFWASSWGERPSTVADAEAVARRMLATVPRLVPLYGHRYMAADPAYAASPVLSVYQTDVIDYGDNLIDDVAHEFGGVPLRLSERTPVPFWSDLVEGV